MFSSLVFSYEDIEDIIEGILMGEGMVLLYQWLVVAIQRKGWESTQRNRGVSD